MMLATTARQREGLTHGMLVALQQGCCIRTNAHR